MPIFGNWSTKHPKENVDERSDKRVPIFPFCVWDVLSCVGFRWDLFSNPENHVIVGIGSTPMFDKTRTHTHMHDIHKRCRQTFEIHKYPYLCVSIYVRAHVEYVHVDTVYAFAHVINARKTHTHIYICTNICVICGCDLCLHGHQVEARCFAWCMHSASLWLKLELILRNVKKSIGLLSILLGFY